MGRRGRGIVAVLVLAALVALAAPTSRASSPLTGVVNRVVDQVPLIGVRPAHPVSDPVEHLEAILALSPPPEYRRLGSPGMAAVADHLESRLAAAGFETALVGEATERWKVDYSPGHEPMLRLPDGREPRTESGFELDGGTTPPEGITCRVVEPAHVRPGDCGFVDFGTASPEWKNLLAAPRAAIDEVWRRGGAGIVVQGDPARRLVFALSVRRPVPTVVSVVDSSIVGRTVTLRAMGERETTQLRNVVGYLPPRDGSAGDVVVLLAHTDSWFQGAVDNGAGTAAVMAAAERLAAGRPSSLGVLVLLVDGEEVGLLGSEQLVGHMRDGGLSVGGRAIRVGDVAAVVNLDAPTAKPSDVHDLVAPVLGDIRVPVFSWRVIVTNADPLGIVDLVTPFLLQGVAGLPVTEDVWFQISGGGWRTDAAHFDELGVPVVWPVAGYPEYHTDGDTIDRVDVGDLRALVDGTVDLVRALDARR